MSIEISQTNMQKERRMRKKNVKEQRGNFKKYNIYKIGLPEEWEKKAEKYVWNNDR